MEQLLSEKKTLLAAFMDLHDRLEELEQAVETTFSDSRLSLYREAFENMIMTQRKLSVLENKYGSIETLRKNAKTGGPQKLKLELGF